MKTYIKEFAPLVVESFRHIEYANKTYKRRLRISGFNACQLDKLLGTYSYQQGTRFVILDKEDIEKACNFLGVIYKDVNTYFEIDLNMCSFSKVP